VKEERSCRGEGKLGGIGGGEKTSKCSRTKKKKIRERGDDEERSSKMKPWEGRRRRKFSRGKKMTREIYGPALRAGPGNWLQIRRLSKAKRKQERIRCPHHFCTKRQKGGGKESRQAKKKKIGSDIKETGRSALGHKLMSPISLNWKMKNAAWKTSLAEKLELSKDKERHRKKNKGG